MPYPPYITLKLVLTLEKLFIGEERHEMLTNECEQLLTHWGRVARAARGRAQDEQRRNIQLRLRCVNTSSIDPIFGLAPQERDLGDLSATTVPPTTR